MLILKGFTREMMMVFAFVCVSVCLSVSLLCVCMCVYVCVSVCQGVKGMNRDDGSMEKG